MGGVAAPLYQGIRNEISGVTNVIPVFKKSVNSVEIKDQDKTLVIL